MELGQFQAQSDPTGWREQISQSTGDYYSFYDFSTGLVHFTRNALKATHIFQLENWCAHWSSGANMWMTGMFPA